MEGVLILKNVVIVLYLIYENDSVVFLGKTSSVFPHVEF